MLDARQYTALDFWSQSFENKKLTDQRSSFGKILSPSMDQFDAGFSQWIADGTRSSRGVGEEVASRNTAGDKSQSTDAVSSSVRANFL